MNGKPTSILVDLDDCLYDYDGPHTGALTATLHHLSIRLSLPIETLEKEFLRARESVQQRLANTASSHSKLVQFKRMLDNLGLGSRSEIALDLESIYWGNFLRTMAASNGVLEFLQACRELEIEVFVVTDLTLQIQIRKLAALDLLPYCSGVLASEEIGNDKPHIGFKEELQARFSPDLSNVWVIGDSAEKDGGLANSFDAQFFHVPRTSKRLGFFSNLTRFLRNST